MKILIDPLIEIYNESMLSVIEWGNLSFLALVKRHYFALLDFYRS